MATNYTPEQLLKLGEPSAEFQEVLKAAPELAQITLSYKKDDIYGLRENMNKARASPTPTPDHINVVDRKIAMRDGAEIPIRIYSPVKPDAQGSPLIVNYHGGAFMLGDLEMGVEFGRKMVTTFNAVLVDVDYRLAPEFTFPTPINDGYDALKWVAENAASLKSNPELGFIVAGVSAGANFAASLSLQARDNKLSPPLTGVFSIAPSTLHYHDVPEKYKSRFLALEQNKAAPILNLPFYEYIDEWLKPDPSSPLFSPLLHPKGFKGLPRIYIVACGLDPIRDDAILYEEALREEGVETKMDVYPGLPHCWWSALPQLESSKKYEHDSMEGLKWLLRRE